MAEKRRYYIYTIINKVNNKGYVGCASGGKYPLPQRKANHLWQLRNGKHPNSTIQEDYDKYGEDAFDWCNELENIYTTKEEAMKIERFWMDVLQTRNPKGYNAIFDGYKPNDDRERWMDDMREKAWESNKKPVLVLETNEVYPSAKETAEAVGMHEVTIQQHCRGLRVTQKFKYVE